MTSPPDQFAVRCERLEEGKTLVVVSGELDLGTAPRLAGTLAPLVDAGSTRVAIDLTGVPFVDSAGISVLMNADRRFTRAGGALVVAGVHPNVRRTLELVRLDSTLAIEPTAEAALARLDDATSARWRFARQGAGAPVRDPEHG
jgi:anti-sigma B factor antagonist